MKEYTSKEMAKMCVDTLEESNQYLFLNSENILEIISDKLDKECDEKELDFIIDSIQKDFNLIKKIYSYEEPDSWGDGCLIEESREYLNEFEEWIFLMSEKDSNVTVVMSQEDMERLITGNEFD